MALALISPAAHVGLWPTHIAVLGGEPVLSGVRTAIRDGFAVVVPAGTRHNIINTGTVTPKLYTIYAPPNHRDGVVHHTRTDADADTGHFDGNTTQ